MLSHFKFYIYRPPIPSTILLSLPLSLSKNTQHTVMADILSGEQIVELQEAFSLFDKDGDGMLYSLSLSWFQNPNKTLFFFFLFLIIAWNCRVHNHRRTGYCDQIFGSESNGGGASWHDQRGRHRWQRHHRIRRVLESHGQQNEGIFFKKVKKTKSCMIKNLIIF